MHLKQLEMFDFNESYRVIYAKVLSRLSPMTQ